ncbi:MAG: superoxide dismutase family protein [Planctomycetota bacterium]|nr:MAG: superoxide dismutase family protein [Planctomycetota bacterium]REJ87742.1 MAG: superoxide dismutase family protein [Planctomycetota bacterium]REK27825.1 MAG: superoxide dismutase family protein [Planctomycetota bacterium]REK40279.1 MAG: superoxide dismutase family protein [Planctomycetota bacterium]
MRSLKLTAVALSLIGASLALAQTRQSERPDLDRTEEEVSIPKEAVAVLSPTKGNDVEGTLIFRQDGDILHVTGEVKGLEPGEHGFHIHEFGDLRDPDGKSAGGHFNPHGVAHGGPDDAEHHAGDLGNITANDRGVARVDKKAEGLKLHFVIGRAIVVHGGEDDFTSQPSGDAGPRVALGVIGFANVEHAKETRAE